MAETLPNTRSRAEVSRPLIGVIMGKSPLALLTGLGALTAVLLLVFRESILGLIASIEIASYDLVRAGEWIEVPAYEADGEVVDISLHTIRIQNWDKTIVSLPTTALLEKGFKNWRGMSESGGRRIKRSLSLDMSSVRFLEDSELDRLSGVEMLEPYLTRKSKELKTWNAEVRSGDVLRRRRLTNLGTFRAYLEAFLHQHPEVSQEHTFLVRQLPPGAEGIPIEIYVFSLDQRWAEYEASRPTSSTTSLPCCLSLICGCFKSLRERIFEWGLDGGEQRDAATRRVKPGPPSGD